jgi:hypothetical protein
MKYEIGASAGDLMRRFKFPSRDALDFRVSSIAKMLQAYFVYFALNNHDDTIAQLPGLFGAGAPGLLQVFCGAAQVYGGYKCADVDGIASANVRAFVKTLIEVSKHKRL